MKLVNFIENDKVCLGIRTELGILNVAEAAAAIGKTLPSTIEGVIGGGEKILAQLSELIELEQYMISEENVIYAPCIMNPEKILCVGLNYFSHGEECKVDIPKYPALFSKFNNTLAAHQQKVKLLPHALKYDYEAELVIVIGKEAVNVSKEAALSYVFGYMVGNDLSARDLQFLTGQWLLGKTCDGFAPIGPYLVTADEVNPDNLDISCEVNGEVRQFANTSELIFDCATIISYISKYMTLKPGDIIFTGTPGGVILGKAQKEQQWLKAGDEIKVSIKELGTLVNILI